MAFSPVGVAMGVLGELHSHEVHPVGQVPSAVGAWHPRITPTGPGTLQHNCPGIQQLLPQHVPPGPQRGPLQGGSLQTPLSQKGVVGSHLLPHAPQLLMSFSRFVQALSQQVKSQKPQSLPPEPLELPGAPPLPPVAIEPPLPPVPIPPVPPAPPDADAEEDETEAPPPPPWMSDPQPAMTNPIKLTRKILCCMVSTLSCFQRRKHVFVETHHSMRSMAGC